MQLCMELLAFKIRKFEVLGGQKILFRIIHNSNNREIDININNPQNDYYQGYLLLVKHKFWACLGGVPFTHRKHMLL